MDNVTGNCTGTKADITVKTVFDGNQSGQRHTSIGIGIFSTHKFCHFASKIIYK